MIHLPLRADAEYRAGISLDLIYALQDRIGVNLPAHLVRDAFSAAGYCLDAPETLPAGGCYQVECSEIWIDRFDADQVTVKREVR